MNWTGRQRRKSIPKQHVLWFQLQETSAPQNNTSKTLTMVPFSITPISIENGSASSLILSGLAKES